MALSLPRKKKIDLIPIGQAQSQGSLSMGTPHLSSSTPLTVRVANQPNLSPVVRGPANYRYTPPVYPPNFFTNLAVGAKGIGDTLVGIGRAPFQSAAAGLATLRHEKGFDPRGNWLNETFLGDKYIKNSNEQAKEAANAAQSLATSKIDIANNKVTYRKGDIGNKLPAAAIGALGAGIVLSNLVPGVGGAKKKGAEDVVKGVGDAVAAEKVAKNTVKTTPTILPKEKPIVTPKPPAPVAPPAVEPPVIKPTVTAKNPALVTIKGKQLDKSLFENDIQKYMKRTGADRKRAEDTIYAAFGRTVKDNAVDNTAKNPFKSPIPKVKAGDYKQIISNEQTASNPTLVAGNRWQITMQQLKKKSPTEYANFWRHVEDPKSVKSPVLQKAVAAWREVDNRVHGTSQALGGNTNYLTDHGLHPWNLPEDVAQHLTNGGDIQNFPGINSMERKYRNIAEGEANGLTLGTDPLGEGTRYINASAGSLRRRAIIKGIGEADGHIANKTHYLDMGTGETIPLSADAHSALKGLQAARYSNNKLIRGVRTTNGILRTSILSGGQFHPINISLLRAGPSIAMAGHPIRAVKGMVGTFSATKGRVESMYSKAFSDKIVDPGTGKNISLVDAAAKIGSPYAQRGYDTAGSALKSGIGHKLVFERQIPMMHNQVVRSVLSDLVRKGVPLDSAAARQAGIAANSTMGFINKEALNLPTWVRKGMADWMLAGQFTPSKIVTLSKVAKGGVAGKYARADVISNVAAATAMIVGVGYLLGQNHDDLRDSLLRALIDPAIPTNMKDKKGNNVELRIPLTYTAEIAKILGIGLERGKDGHLTVTWHPEKSLDAHSGLLEWMRSRLAPLQSDVLKVATNTDFADKPLYDPNASTGTKVVQGATIIGTGMLPIGAQGLAYTDQVKNLLPQDARDVLNANTPGTNPVLKSLGASAGFSPRTDKYSGKGLDTKRFFDAADEAKSGLVSDGQRALDGYIGSKKNPVTGKYDVAPTVWDTISKAADLLKANDSATSMGKRSPIDALIDMNKQIANKGGKVDPLWSQPKDKIIKYLQYQSNPDPFSPQRSVWYNSNKGWYQPLSDQRSKFFSSLPPGDPNKPQAPVEYPNPTPTVQKLKDQYYKITDSKQAFKFSQDHPELQNQFDKEFQYKNDLLKNRGYAQYKDYPKASSKLQSYLDKYVAADKAGRKAIRNSDPQAYKNMVSYFDSVDLYNINKEGAKNQLQGQPDQTNKQNKAISNLAKDIYQKPDGSYSIVPAGWMQGLSNGSGSGGYGSRGGRKGGANSRSMNPNKYRISVNAGGKIARPKVTAKKGKAIPKKYVAKGISKPKVTLRKSLV